MPSIVLPGAVAASIRKDHGRGLAEVGRILEFKERLQGLFARFTDVFLAVEDDELHNLRKGFWYLERTSDDGTVSFIESSDADGGYREPDDRTLDALRRSDTWSRDVWGEIEKARGERARRKDKERAELSREFRETLDDRLKHVHDVQVPITHKEN